MLRVVQEALTNVRKHAPGAEASVAVHAGETPHDELVLVVANRPTAAPPAPARDDLATSGGGYGLQGMRERAQLLGGTLTAGTTDGGWRVELHLPAPGAEEGDAVNGPAAAREEVR
jgi:signal transduction histidine kinase